MQVVCTGRSAAVSLPTRRAPKISSSFVSPPFTADVQTAFWRCGPPGQMDRPWFGA